MKLQSIWWIERKKFYLNVIRFFLHQIRKIGINKWIYFKGHPRHWRSSKKKSFDQNQISKCCKRNDKCRKRFNWILNKQIEKTHTYSHSLECWLKNGHLFGFFCRLLHQLCSFVLLLPLPLFNDRKIWSIHLHHMYTVPTTLFARSIARYMCDCFVWSCLNDDA